jgi:hypothetical protein
MSENVAELKNGLMDVHNDDHSIWPVGTSKKDGNSEGTNSVKGTSHN